MLLQYYIEKREKVFTINKTIRRKWAKKGAKKGGDYGFYVCKTLPKPNKF